MTIVKRNPGLKGKTLIGSVGKPEASEPMGSGPNAEDLAFLSRMIKLGFERQANMPTPIDAYGFLVPQPPYIDPDQEAGEERSPMSPAGLSPTASTRLWSLSSNSSRGDAKL